MSSERDSTLIDAICREWDIRTETGKKSMAENLLNFLLADNIKNSSDLYNLLEKLYQEWIEKQSRI